MSTYFYRDNLESVRLVTRKLTKNDVTVWTNFFNDQKALEFLPNWGLTSCEELANFWIDRQLKCYSENKVGLQALISKATSDFIGMCGLLL